MIRIYYITKYMNHKYDINEIVWDDVKSIKELSGWLTDKVYLVEIYNDIWDKESSKNILDSLI